MGWLAGVTLNALGNISINFGTNLMKYGHNMKLAAEEAELHDDIMRGDEANDPLPKPTLTRPRSRSTVMNNYVVVKAFLIRKVKIPVCAALFTFLND